MKQSFPTSEKLKSKKLIDQLFSEGKSVHIYPVKLIYTPIQSKNEMPKTGVSVPKRNFKKAVERVTLKRLLRETYRKNKYIITNNMSQPYAFMFIYLGKKQIEYHQLFLVMEKLLKKWVEKEKQYDEKINR